MSDPIIGSVVTQLGSIMEQEFRQELRLVVGVEKDIENLESMFKSIRAVLLDAEMSRVTKEKEKEGVELWLQNLQEISYEMDDVLAEWSNAILKIEMEGRENTSAKKRVCFFLNLPCFCFGRVISRRDIALKIKEINGRLEQIAHQKNMYNFKEIPSPAAREMPKTASCVDVSEACGRDEDKNALIKELLKENSRADRGLHLISVVGMGGIGKTFLAQLAFNSPEVEKHFQKRIWVCVSEPFDVSRIAKAILEEAAEGNAHHHLVELDPILTNLKNSIAGKRFLLVLDDVWTGDQKKWDPLRASLKDGAAGSKVLVTTRNEGVAKLIGSGYTLPLGVLSEQHCWSLFSKIAFFGRSKEDREELEDIGRRIAKKCRGLPLSAKTVGGLMRLKNSIQDWQSVLDSFTWELEATDEGPFRPLLLSYSDMLSPLRRCFSYCAIFPKDYKIEADNLIKLWMAQGYLSSKENMEMEGREYLDNLIMRCFFQDLEKDKDSEVIVRFKMHDMVHDFAEYLTKNECYVKEVDDNLESRITKARHLTLVRAEDVPFPASIGDTEKAHTFWIQSFYDCPALVSEEDKVSPDLFNDLLRVKALDLSRNRLLELPEEIGKLMNVRYLNLSHNPLSELPETICGLYNLQTLKLVACEHLSRLPHGIGRLLNLRHLEIDRTDSLKALPKGIGSLHFLQTLNKFILSGSKDPEETNCNLGDLKELNLLRGYLKIEGLGLVSNVKEARAAALKKKAYLTDLHMDFNPLPGSDTVSEVAEALQVHTDLQSLQISFYGGSHLPSWITSLTNLRKLQLQDCQSCIQLPPLGRLPLLQTLYIENMHELKRIGSEFLGADANVAASSTSPISIFPKLKKLKFENMRSWEEWELISQQKKGVEEGNFKIMPCLRYLKLSDCGKLKALPDSLLQDPSIRKLRISKCPLLQQQYQKGSGQHSIKVSHIPKVRIS